MGRSINRHTSGNEKATIRAWWRTSALGLRADTYPRPTFQRRGAFRARVHLGANLHLGELAELDGLEPVAGY